MLKRTFQLRPTFSSGSRALFTGPVTADTFFNKNNFKTGSDGTIHIFKNDFATVVSKRTLNEQKTNFFQNEHDMFINNSIHLQP